MKNLLPVVFEQSGPWSKKLMFSSFMAGYLLATLLFAFYRPQIHHFMDLIF